ncbi:hypothetical protein QZH41_012728 [Actinostola sp. cb2023]|nr:hypothetical protein QZH41_012728 [Actinostola sp. cb2023]
MVSEVGLYIYKLYYTCKTWFDHNYFAVSAGSFKVGNVKCTFGPSYWCQNYKQAKECNAIQHCQDRVWKASSNETCAACQAALNEVKTLLAQPEIDKMILGYLEQACAEFGSLAAECKALVEQYEPLVLKELQQLLANPKQLCIEFGLCSASREKIMAVLLQKALPVKLKSFAGFNLKKHILKAINPVKASAECILCEFIASELDDLLGKNATQQEIKDALDKVCSFLPSTIGTECKSFVDKYAAEILQILSQELNPKIICTTLNLCSSKGHVQGN